MVTGWILYPKYKEGNIYDVMLSSAKMCGIELVIVFAEDILASVTVRGFGLLHKGEEVEKPLFVFMRHYDYTLAVHLEMMGINVYNTPLSMNSAENKMLSHIHFTKHNIPTPKTFYGVKSYEEAVRLLGSDNFIQKHIYGSKGEKVFLIKEQSDFISKPDYIVQEYVEYSRGRDIRVWVIGDKAIACVERYNDNSYLSNYAQGGSVRGVYLSEEIASLAVRASQCIGLDISGVDILYTKEGGYTVCEVNGNAGFRTLYATRRDIDITFEMFKYIADKLQL